MSCGESCYNLHESWHSISQVEHFIELLEECAYKLNNQCGMHDQIPFVQSEKQQQIRSELQGKSISVNFNGTTQWSKLHGVIDQIPCVFSISGWLV